jgi:hypothetical protein
MFINDIFKKKTITESLRTGEYITYRVFFNDGSEETINFSGDEIDWDRVGAKRGKQVVNAKQQGGIRGAEYDTPQKPHAFPDDSMARAQRAYDRKIPEGGFDIPEIPRAPTPKPPADKNVKEGMFGLDEKTKAKIQNIAVEISDIPGYWDWERDTFTPYGILALEEALGDKKYVKYALSLTADDDYAYEGVAEGSLTEFAGDADIDEGFEDLDRFMKDKYGPKPSGGSGIKRGTYGQPGRRRGRPTGATGGEGSGIPQAVEFDRPHSERSAGRRLPRFSDDYDAIRRSEVDEGSAQDRLHRRHQELRKKSGLPDPDYYKELKASYDIADDRERLARQAEIKKKYRVAETVLNPKDPQGDYDAKRKVIHDLSLDPNVNQQAVQQRRLDLDREAKSKGLKEQGVAEGSFGSGYGSVFTLYVNTGEKSTTKTKTKKFKREDDAVLWAEDYADQHEMFPNLKMEIQDENGNVVWELEEPQGVAEAVEVVDQDYDLDQMIFTLDVDGKKISFTYWDYEEDFANADINEIRAQVAERLGQLPDQQQEQVAQAVYTELRQNLDEAGPFSYGAKKPRRGSVADLAAKKRQEQERGRQPIEPRDQRVGTAKVTTNEDIEGYLEEMRRAGYDIVTESATLCPECGGPAYEDKMLAEKQDACYSKVKSRYKVWPSAYASGALVRCRKVGAKNWGNKSKK